MISRRIVTLSLIVAPTVLPVFPALSQGSEEEDLFAQLTYPTFGALSDPEKFGYQKPTQAQRDKADGIVNQTPKGPTPLAVARSFVERYAQSDPKAISQWPAPDQRSWLRISATVGRMTFASATTRTHADTIGRRVTSFFLVLLA
jgi:hypothetical protein